MPYQCVRRDLLTQLQNIERRQAQSSPIFAAIESEPSADGGSVRTAGKTNDRHEAGK
jgi:hypothetical protein